MNQTLLLITIGHPLSQDIYKAPVMSILATLAFIWQNRQQKKRNKGDRILVFLSNLHKLQPKNIGYKTAEKVVDC